MNKIITFILFSVLITSNIFAQQGFKYQAVARDNGGAIIDNQSISIEISVIQNNINNSPIFTETHNVTTNDYGLFNLEVGTGTATLGSFASIDWALSSFVNIAMDVTGGSNFQDMGTSQLFAVPRALYAEKAGVLSGGIFGLNVKDFGAKGDGEANDTQKFKNAIDSAAVTGAKIFIPAGVYKIQNTLTIPAGVTLIGEGIGSEVLQTPFNGTLIKFEGNGVAIKIIGSAAGLRDMVIADKNVGNANGAVQILANGSLVESVRLHNILMTNFTGGFGLQLKAKNSGGVAYGSYYNIRVRNAKNGYHITQDATSFTNSNTFHHGAVSGGGFDHCLLVDNGNNNNFYGTIFEPYSSTVAHVLVKKGEVQLNNIRIEGNNQAADKPLIKFKNNTRNSTVTGTYAGGLILDDGNNFIDIRSGKAIGFKNSSSNLLQNATFHGFDGTTLPHWDISGNTVSVKTTKPRLTSQHKILKLSIPGNSTVEFKPAAADIPELLNHDLYGQVNFGFFVKSTVPDAIYGKVRSEQGITISQKYSGNNKWQLVGMNANIDKNLPLDFALVIENTSADTIVVRITAPTLNFGNQTPEIDAKPITTAGGVIDGLLTTSMTTIKSLPNDGFLDLPLTANVFEITKNKTIYRINHTNVNRFPKGSVITLLFDQAGVNVTSSAYLLLKGGFTSVANGSLTLISKGDGTWREVSRNN